MLGLVLLYLLPLKMNIIGTFILYLIKKNNSKITLIDDITILSSNEKKVGKLIIENLLKL